MRLKLLELLPRVCFVQMGRETGEGTVLWAQPEAGIGGIGIAVSKRWTDVIGKVDVLW